MNASTTSAPRRSVLGYSSDPFSASGSPNLSYGRSAGSTGGQQQQLSRSEGRRSRNVSGGGYQYTQGNMRRAVSSEQSPYASSAGATAPSPYLITVIPPNHLPHDPPHPRASQLSAGYGPPEHFRRGTLIPLYPTLAAQLAAVAREYSLPSTGGLCLYLLSAVDPNSPSAPLAGSVSLSGADGPRIGDQAWEMLWGPLFASESRSPRAAYDSDEDRLDSDDEEDSESLDAPPVPPLPTAHNLNAYPSPKFPSELYSGPPSSTSTASSARRLPSDSDPLFSDPESEVTSSPSSSHHTMHHSHSQRNSQRKPPPLPTPSASLAGSTRRRKPSQTLPLPQLHIPPPRSAAAPTFYGAGAVVGKVEFDIDWRRGGIRSRWYEGWAAAATTQDQLSNSLEPPRPAFADMSRSPSAQENASPVLSTPREPGASSGAFGPSEAARGSKAMYLPELVQSRSTTTLAEPVLAMHDELDSDSESDDGEMARRQELEEGEIEDDDDLAPSGSSGTPRIATSGTRSLEAEEEAMSLLPQAEDQQLESPSVEFRPQSRQESQPTEDEDESFVSGSVVDHGEEVHHRDGYMSIASPAHEQNGLAWSAAPSHVSAEDGHDQLDADSNASEYEDDTALFDGMPLAPVPPSGTPTLSQRAVFGPKDYDEEATWRAMEDRNRRSDEVSGLGIMHAPISPAFESTSRPQSPGAPPLQPLPPLKVPSPASVSKELQPSPSPTSASKELPVSPTVRPLSNGIHAPPTLLASPIRLSSDLSTSVEETGVFPSSPPDSATASTAFPATHLGGDVDSWANDMADFPDVEPARVATRELSVPTVTHSAPSPDQPRSTRNAAETAANAWTQPQSSATLPFFASHFSSEPVMHDANRNSTIQLEENLDDLERALAELSPRAGTSRKPSIPSPSLSFFPAPPVPLVIPPTVPPSNFVLQPPQTRTRSPSNAAQVLPLQPRARSSSNAAQEPHLGEISSTALLPSPSSAASSPTALTSTVPGYGYEATAENAAPFTPDAAVTVFEEEEEEEHKSPSFRSGMIWNDQDRPTPPPSIRDASSSPERVRASREETRSPELAVSTSPELALPTSPEVKPSLELKRSPALSVSTGSAGSSGSPSTGGGFFKKPAFGKIAGLFKKPSDGDSSPANSPTISTFAPMDSFPPRKSSLDVMRAPTPDRSLSPPPPLPERNAQSTSLLRTGSNERSLSPMPVLRAAASSESFQSAVTSIRPPSPDPRPLSPIPVDPAAIPVPTTPIALRRDELEVTTPRQNLGHRSPRSDYAPHSTPLPRTSSRGATSQSAPATPAAWKTPSTPSGKRRENGQRVSSNIDDLLASMGEFNPGHYEEVKTDAAALPQTPVSTAKPELSEPLSPVYSNSGANSPLYSTSEIDSPRKMSDAQDPRLLSPPLQKPSRLHRAPSDESGDYTDLKNVMTGWQDDA